APPPLAPAPVPTALPSPFGTVSRGAAATGAGEMSTGAILRDCPLDRRTGADAAADATGSDSPLAIAVVASVAAVAAVAVPGPSGLGGSSCRHACGGRATAGTDSSARRSP